MAFRKRKHIKREKDILSACESIKNFIIDQCILDSQEENENTGAISKNMEISNVLENFCKFNLHSVMNDQKKTLSLTTNKTTDNHTSSNLNLYVHSLTDEMVEDLIHDHIYASGMPHHWNYKLKKFCRARSAQSTTPSWHHSQSSSRFHSATASRLWKGLSVESNPTVYVSKLRVLEPSIDNQHKLFCGNSNISIRLCSIKMGKKGSVLVEFLKNALFEKKYENLKFEDVSKNIFILYLPQKSNKLKVKDQMLFKDWYALKNRIYILDENYTKAKQALISALKKSEYLEVKAIKKSFWCRILNDQEIKEKKETRKLQKIHQDIESGYESTASPSSINMNNGSFKNIADELCLSKFTDKYLENMHGNFMENTYIPNNFLIQNENNTVSDKNWECLYDIPLEELFFYNCNEDSEETVSPTVGGDGSREYKFVEDDLMIILKPAT
ncbi:uncharacterized protein CDAR_104911 [Caerostris darwini]|uniref:Uncharacterized protein n=1 Tax=Caerostris darwini TaxID=1538125 RepID=A0AAV4V5T6_9ARAC|nr:uncharacterized protein CDAR_104911 [Caerostris darwini]